MALSGGTLAALIGALGLGGYLWYQKSKAAQGATACQKMVATAAAAGGYPTNDALTKSVCGGIDSILEGGITGITKLPGVQLASSAAKKVAEALPWTGESGCNEKSPASLCPTGTKALNVHYAKDLGIAFPSTVGGASTCWVCVDAKDQTKLVGVVAGGAFRPWTYSGTAPGGVVIPTAGGTTTSGRTSGGVTVSSGGSGSLWSKFIS